MKRTLTIILAFSLLLTILYGCGGKTGNTDGTKPPTQEELDQINSDLNDNSSEYFKFDSATGTIMGFKDSVSGVTDIEIPSEIDGVVVRGIGDAAFQFRNLTNVVFPDTLETIGNSAFKENKLTEVIFPDSLREFGFGAFWDNELTEVTIPDGFTEVAIAAFRNNKITEINLPDSVTIIRRGAFQENLLTELIVPDNIVLLESGAFEDNLIENLVLNDGLEEICGFAFDKNKLTSLTIPASVKRIGDASEGAIPAKNYKGSAFSDNQLTSITILSSDTELDEFMMGENNYFREAYLAGGAGTYEGEQLGTWEKVSDN